MGSEALNCQNCNDELDDQYLLVQNCYWCLRERVERIDWKAEAKHFRRALLKRQDEEAADLEAAEIRGAEKMKLAVSRIVELSGIPESGFQQIIKLDPSAIVRSK